MNSVITWPVELSSRDNHRGSTSSSDFGRLSLQKMQRTIVELAPELLGDISYEPTLWQRSF